WRTGENSSTSQSSFIDKIDVFGWFSNKDKIEVPNFLNMKYDEVAGRCEFITPVPGGVGPMTIIGLLRNTISAFKGEVYPSR
ncbi:MAG: hypothetical protein IKX13_06255, partial [Bacteroidales bacterium]|nr:hypothetical protein [Bacteroidales bacterium]